VLRVKNVLHVHRAKTASHVASVKNVYVNCASLWTPLQLQQPPQPLPLKSVRPVSHVKSAHRVRRVKSVNRVPSRPLLPSLKKK
jgi:hypothetical protein